MIYIFLLIFAFNVFAEDDFFDDDITEFVTTQEQENYYDPLEKANRVTFYVSSLGTKYILLPIAKGYKNTVPEKVQPNIASVANTFNIATSLPYTILILQKPVFVENSSAILTNTFFGFFGFFDVHGSYNDNITNVNLDAVAQYYYSKKMPYLFLPWGPSNVAGIGDFTSQIYFRNNLPQELWTVSFTGIVSQISENYDIIYDGIYNSIDSYAVTRNFYYSLQEVGLKRIKEKQYNPIPYKALIPQVFNS